MSELKESYTRENGEAFDALIEDVIKHYGYKKVARTLLGEIIERFEIESGQGKVIAKIQYDDLLGRLNEN